MKKLKLISLNIEKSKHLPSVISFLKKEHADIVCLQEVMKKDLPLLAGAAGSHHRFIPMTRIPDGTGSKRSSILGIALFSKHSLTHAHHGYYYGRKRPIPTYTSSESSVHRALLWATITVQKHQYTIGTTHFTWTPHGLPNAKQRQDVKALIALTATLPSIMFCGDFNAPRGGEIFQTLAQHFVDHIPKKYHQSLDLRLHRNKNIHLMVDALFSTQDYHTRQVQLLKGVSDHKAIRAYLSRSQQVL